MATRIYNVPKQPEKVPVDVKSWKDSPRFNFVQMDPDTAAQQIGRSALSSIRKVAMVKGEKGCLRLPLKTPNDFTAGIAIHLESSDEYCIEAYFSSLLMDSGNNLHRKYLSGLYFDQLTDYVYTYGDLAAIKKIFAEEWKAHQVKAKAEKAMIGLVARMMKLQRSNKDAYDRLTAYMDTLADKNDVDAVEKKLSELEKEKTEGNGSMLKSRFLNEDHTQGRTTLLKSSYLTEVAKGVSDSDPKAVKILIAKTIKGLKYALDNAEGDDELVDAIRNLIDDFKDIEPEQSLTMLLNYVPDHDQETFGKDVFNTVIDYVDGLEKLADKLDKKRK